MGIKMRKRRTTRLSRRKLQHKEIRQSILEECWECYGAVHLEATYFVQRFSHPQKKTWIYFLLQKWFFLQSKQNYKRKFYLNENWWRYWVWSNPWFGVQGKIDFSANQQHFTRALQEKYLKNQQKCSKNQFCHQRFSGKGHLGLYCPRFLPYIVVV
jgi:hypothetical protein